MRLSKDERRAAELRKGLQGISSGVYRKPKGLLSSVRSVYDTQADDLADKIQPHIANLKTEILAELSAVKTPVDVTENLAREIIKVMKKLPEGDRLDVSDIRNFQSFVYGGQKYGVHEMMHGAGQAVTFTFNEVVAGSSHTFTLAATPTTGTVTVFGNGQFLTPGGVDYTISGAVITTINSFSAGTIIANYQS